MTRSAVSIPSNIAQKIGLIDDVIKSEIAAELKEISDMLQALASLLKT